MKHFLFSLLTLLVISCTSSAQQQIVITIDDSPTGTFELKQLKGEQQLKIAEAAIKKNQLIFSDNFEPGIYAVFNNGKGISFIVNEPKVHLKSNWSSPYSKIEVIDSKENDYWLAYKNKRNIIFNQLKLLHPITIGYEKSSPFYEEAKKEFYAIQDELIDYVKTMDSSTLAYSFINADLRPALAHDQSYEAQKNSLKTKWFNSLDWNDERLLNSDILPLKINDFMGLYFDNKLSIQEQEEAFINGIDVLLTNASQNTKIKEFVLSHLVRKLEQFQMENVILHIAENYAHNEESCEKESSTSEIIERLKRFEQMSIGKVAPNIVGMNLQDKTVDAFSKASDKNLLIFWSSNCTHCRDMMPGISSWYKKSKQKGWNLITVSLDTDKTELEKAISDLNLDIPIVTDYKGWDSEIALNYNVSSTPSMFVLNKNRKILGKPNWLSELTAFD